MHKDWRLIRLFWRYLAPERFWVWLSVATIPLSTFATLITPYLMVQIVDQHLTQGDAAGLAPAAGLLVLAVVGGYFMDSVYSYGLQRSGLVAITHLRRDLFRHSLTLPRAYFDKHPIGVTLSRMTSDMEAIGESLAVGVLGLISDLIKTIGLFGMLVYLSWKLSLIMLVVFPVVYFIVTFLRRELRRYFDLSRDALASATAYLAEALHGIKTIQLFAAEDKALQAFQEKNGKFLDAQNRSNLYDAILFSVIEGLTSVTLALVIWYGTGQILGGLLTIGVLVGFINTLNRIFIPVREFAQQVAMIQRALSALEHAHGLLEQPSQPDPPATGRPLGRFESLVFQNVVFAYQTEPVLKGVSFTLQRGMRMAIVGATGSGKSTILRLLTQAYGGYQGSIQLNGQELSQLPPQELLPVLSLMQQDVHLFDETIAFNISLARPGVDEAQVRAAAAYVYADRFIDELPQGYETRLLEGGKNLSAGQAQLISFARAMAGEADLILLDEATASVDSLTEELIQKATDRILSAKTVIAIAHRLSTVQHSDLILVMDKGRIVERGTHQELAQAGGVYAGLLKELSQTEAPAQLPAVTEQNA